MADYDWDEHVAAAAIKDGVDPILIRMLKSAAITRQWKEEPANWPHVSKAIRLLQEKTLLHAKNPHRGVFDGALTESLPLFGFPTVNARDDAKMIPEVDDETSPEAARREIELAMREDATNDAIGVIIDDWVDRKKAGRTQFTLDELRDTLRPHRNKALRENYIAEQRATERLAEEAIYAGLIPIIAHDLIESAVTHKTGFWWLRNLFEDYMIDMEHTNKTIIDANAENARGAGANRDEISKLLAGLEADRAMGRPVDYLDLFNKVRAHGQKAIDASKETSERVRKEAIKAGVVQAEAWGLWIAADLNQIGVLYKNFYDLVVEELHTLIREKEAEDEAKAYPQRAPDIPLPITERAHFEVESISHGNLGDRTVKFWASKAVNARERAISVGADVGLINNLFDPDPDSIFYETPDYYKVLVAILKIEEDVTREVKRVREKEAARKEKEHQEEIARQEEALRKAEEEAALKKKEQEAALQAALTKKPAKITRGTNTGGGKQPPPAPQTGAGGQGAVNPPGGHGQNPGPGPAHTGLGGGAGGGGVAPPAPDPDPPTSTFPPPDTNPIHPPPWPDRPNLSTEVTWAPLCTPEEHRRAYRLWDYVDSQIKLKHFADQRPVTATTLDHEWMDVLGFRVYEAIRQDRYPPFDHDGPGPGHPRPSTGQGKRSVRVDWNARRGLATIFPLESEDIRRMGTAAAPGTGAGGGRATAITVPVVPAPPVALPAPPAPVRPVVVPPKDVAAFNALKFKINGMLGTNKHWTKKNLETELTARGIVPDKTNTKKIMQLYLHEWNIREAAAAATNTPPDPKSSTSQGSATPPTPPAPIQDAGQGWSADFQNRLPRADLAPWGIRREGQFILDIQSDRGLNAVDCLTWAILLCGYNPTYWVSRAFIFFELGFYDLALGDCYRAFRLIETLEDPERRNMMPGLYIRVWDAIEGHINSMGDGNKVQRLAKAKIRGANGVNYFIPTLRRALHHIISKSLFKLQCWDDYLVWDEWLTKRLLMVHRDRTAFEERRREVEEGVRARIEERRLDDTIYFFEKRMGFVEGEAYPQAAADVNRRSQDFRKRINDLYLRGWKTSGNGKLEVRPWRGGLGVFATEDIEADEILYTDEPSARGHLDRTPRPLLFTKTTRGKAQTARDEAQNFVQEPRCENCRRAINVDQFRLQKTAQDANPNPPGQTVACACSDDRIVAKKFFCHNIWQLPEPPKNKGKGVERPEAAATFESGDGGKGKRKRGVTPAPAQPQKKQKKEKEGAAAVPANFPRTCLEIARGLYHYRSCGRDWDWLQKAMMPIWHLENRGVPYPTIGIRGGRYLTHNNEKHGTVLSMILRDVFDTTLRQRTSAAHQNILAHETEELLPLFGAESNRRRLFPFGWAANILVPFEMLLNLGVDIFTDLTFDTWVIQTVLHKLLMNVVPWDDHLRVGEDRYEDVDWVKDEPEAPLDPPKGYSKNIPGGGKAPVPPAPDRVYNEADVRAEIENVYLHTGFAQFNHGCGTSRNAVWMWDSETLNRIVVKASEEIQAGAQIFVGYLPEDAPDTRSDTNWQRARLFGGKGRCLCPECTADDGEEDFPSSLSSSSQEEDDEEEQADDDE